MQRKLANRFKLSGFFSLFFFQQAIASIPGLRLRASKEFYLRKKSSIPKANESEINRCDGEWQPHWYESAFSMHAVPISNNCRHCDATSLMRLFNLFHSKNHSLRLTVQPTARRKVKYQLALCHCLRPCALWTLLIARVHHCILVDRLNWFSSKKPAFAMRTKMMNWVRAVPHKRLTMNDSD